MEYQYIDYAKLLRERLTELREKKGVSAREMSISLGQSDAYINRIENRRGLPSMESFFYICDYFKISPKEFFDTEESSPQKARGLLEAAERLTPEQHSHIMLLIGDLTKDE